MPLPNGVDPWGRIQPVCPSAGFLGNRGILHKENGIIYRQWANKLWVTCAMQYGGRNRKPLMKPSSYSELFFLDEATAFSAGHRPCGECRKEEFKRFKAAWFATHESADMVNSIAEIDKALHAERVTLTKDKKTYRASFAELPDGAMFETNGTAHLKWKGGLFDWSPSGYALSRVVLSGSESVVVLTPASIVRILQAGYVPQVHESAGG